MLWVDWETEEIEGTYASLRVHRPLGARVITTAIGVSLRSYLSLEHRTQALIGLATLGTINKVR